MSFPQFLSVLRARFWAALLVFVLVVATAVGVSLVLPRQYLGEASVVIDVKPDPVALMATPGIALPSFMATQVDILASDRVALRVIKDLKLAENPQIRQQWQDDAQGVGSVEQWLIALLHKQLDVRPSRESNVIAIAYKSPDPRFAAALANAFAQAYIATTLELRVDPAQNFRKFFDVQTQGARDALEKAQSRLSAYQRQHGIIASDERLDVENARLNELSSQLTQLQAISAESSSRQAQAQGAQGDRLQEVLANPVVGGLKAEIARSEARLKELGCGFALDDFGTGFSSFSYLQALPVDLVKIDGSFVRDLDANPTNRALVNAMVAVSHALGRTVVAEMVERAPVAEILRDLGVEYGQGWFWGRPEPIEGDGGGG